MRAQGKRKVDLNKTARNLQGANFTDILNFYIPIFFFQILINRIQEFFSVQILFVMVYFVAMNTYSQAFGHFTAFYSFNTNGFQGITKIYQCLVAV